MTLEGTFCSSPWIHARINNTGQYEYCRWASEATPKVPSIQQQTPVVFFQKDMAPLRQMLLNGESPAICSDCMAMEKHQKISGRQKQLLKTGLNVDHFTETALSSPWLSEFEYSLTHCGETTQLPQDWQVDLGNYCNSACIFCSPEASSKLASEYLKIGLINDLPAASWCNDPVQLSKFLDLLQQSKHIQYLHFIGGETLITPAFYTILEFMVNHELHHNVTVGLTTNLTTWNTKVVDLLTQFKSVNVGASVECLHPLNDYVRYGGTLSKTKELLNQWLALSARHNWYMQLRVTPTLFSIWHIDTIYDFAYNNNIAVESCNFLDEPRFLRPSVLPKELRDRVITKLNTWIATKDPITDNTVVNIRNPTMAKQQIIQDATSYVNYLKNQPDEAKYATELVTYLHKIEASRKNSIIEYIPEYEDFLRSAGY